MAGQIDARLRELGIDLPKPPLPAANYVPFTRSGNTLYISGQVTFLNGELQYVGKIGGDFDEADGKAAARLCGLNIVAVARHALDGDLDRVRQVLKLGGFVNATPDFTGHPGIINGASDLMVEIFGERGTHARFAVGAGGLPLGVAVEVDAILEVE